MKLKAILFAAAIFGATLFVSYEPQNDNNNDPIQKQAVEKAKIKIPYGG